MSSQKEWNFNFGIYANDDSMISSEKCEELMNNIVTWVETNNFSCGGGFSVYPENDHYEGFYDKNRVKKEDFCQCLNSPSIVMMSRYNANPLVCLNCNEYIFRATCKSNQKNRPTPKPPNNLIDREEILKFRVKSYF